MVWITKPTDPSTVQHLISVLKPYDTPLGLIRLGPAGDGGYLVPDDLDGILACVSPGVSTECGFDLAIAERGIDVHMADASVEGPGVAHPRFHFEKKFLATTSGSSTTTIEKFCEAIPGFDSGGDHY